MTDSVRTVARQRSGVWSCLVTQCVVVHWCHMAALHCALGGARSGVERRDFLAICDPLKVQTSIFDHHRSLPTPSAGRGLSVARLHTLFTRAEQQPEQTQHRGQQLGPGFYQNQISEHFQAEGGRGREEAGPHGNALCDQQQKGAGLGWAGRACEDI